MITFVSFLLIVTILVFLFFLKRKYILRTLFNRNKILNNNLSIKSTYYPSKYQSKIVNQKDIKIFSNYERRLLKKKMYSLFQGSKEQKIEALKIAKNISDKSTLVILRRGLKDMDTDIVQISAKLIDQFR